MIGNLSHHISSPAETVMVFVCGAEPLLPDDVFSEAAG